MIGPTRKIRQLKLIEYLIRSAPPIHQTIAYWGPRQDTNISQGDVTRGSDRRLIPLSPCIYYEVLEWRGILENLVLRHFLIACLSHVYKVWLQDLIA